MMQLMTIARVERLDGTFIATSDGATVGGTVRREQVPGWGSVLRWFDAEGRPIEVRSFKLSAGLYLLPSEVFAQ